MMPHQMKAGDRMFTLMNDLLLVIPLLQQFNIVVPPNYNFTAGGLVTTTLEIEELGGDGQ